MMSQETLLDEILPCLADEFETGNQSGRTIEPKSAEEFEPLRECLAMQVAEGWFLRTNFGKLNAYRLTKAGYAKYKPRIDALRALPR
jgi:hypothetical protein